MSFARSDVSSLEEIPSWPNWTYSRYGECLTWVNGESYSLWHGHVSGVAGTLIYRITDFAWDGYNHHHFCDVPQPMPECLASLPAHLMRQVLK